ncbi:Wzz/FepE/Etk N-terminal domain-containing protein [Chitinophaga sp. HK235]|uniref:Wzz/FepE/Etk N-terminal domain-containing protein n=1 Tax=Chitinophaga sp. HK235 TaxID=2952571 RepID=UPI001BA6C9C5|nr:Wzz/FepE/Etk N-terminal domain-containing protein [Chitinophaga sp. HK235]
MDLSQKDSAQIQENELSLKGFILKLINWSRYIWTKKFLILAVALLGGGAGLTVSMLSEPKYMAELTFVLEDNKSGGLGSYAGLASQFGIDIGGGGSGSGVFAADNIVEFLKSRLIVERTLLSSITINGKATTLVQHYINFKHLNETWKKLPALSNITFPVNEDRKLFPLVKDSILNVIRTQVMKSNLIIDKIDKKIGFLSVTCSSEDEFFAKYFSEHLVKEATDFYVQTKTKRSKSNVDKLQQKADSIEHLLNKKTYASAITQDLNLNPAKRMATVGLEMDNRDKIVLQTMYGEVLKNLEMSKMAMLQETPVIQIIDTPILPLRKQKLGKAKGIVLGGFAGGFLALMLVMIRRLYKTVMA